MNKDILQNIKKNRLTSYVQKVIDTLLYDDIAVILDGNNQKNVYLFAVLNNDVTLIDIVYYKDKSIGVEFYLEDFLERKDKKIIEKIFKVHFKFNNKLFFHYFINVLPNENKYDDNKRITLEEVKKIING